MSYKKFMTVTKSSFIVMLLVFGFVGASCAQQSNDLNRAKAELTEFLKGSDLKIQSANYNSAIGLYEFAVNDNEIMYVDKAIKNVFIGNVIGIKNKQDYTQDKIDQISRINFNQLPFDEAVKVVQGTGAVKIAVFTDPDCPFCRKLEKDLAKINNITIYNFLYPIDSLHPQAREKAIQVWCQPVEKRGQVWVEFMRNNKNIPKVATCETPLNHIDQLADQFSLKGTPLIVLPDGKRIDGYLPYNQFTKLLDKYRH